MPVNNNKVKPGDKRLHIDGLMPDTKYAVQVRAIDAGNTSKWSGMYHIETIDDTANKTREPQPPNLKEWKVDASGQYIAIWDTVTHYTDGTPVVVKLYELELVAAQGTVIMAHYGQQAGEQSRSFNFGVLRAYFGGQIPTTIQCRMRVINSAGYPSEWTDYLEASLPVPNPPENPRTESVNDAVKVLWDPPSDPVHLFGYRVYLSMTDPNFIPDSLGKSNMVYQGASTEFTYTSLSYDLVHYFKVVSYSEPGLESTWVTTEGQPKSPYGPDTIAPTQPVLDDPAMDRSVVVSPKANLSWTHDDTVEPNKDTAGFVIRWKLATENRWRNSYFDKAARNGFIDLPQPFANYVFEISAYDFVANFSPYDGTAKTLTGAGAPPGAVEGVDAVARWDGLRVFWNESTESVKYGGEYQVQYNTTGTFADNVPNYRTAATSIDIAGLSALTQYYFRVRAVDSAGQAGPWSATVSKTLPPFPVANTSDGEVPTGIPQNVRATGGLNYINVGWDRVTNSDAVWYEVFGYANQGESASEEFLVGETSGTSLMVTALANNTPLEQETPYYFKVRAVDADGFGPESAEVTSTLTQVLSTDLGINVGGENLLFNSSFDADSGGTNSASPDGLADYWTLHNPTENTEGSVYSLVTGRDGNGKAQRLQWTGVDTSVKGFKQANGQVPLRKSTEHVFSIYARGNGGTVDIVSSAISGKAVLESPEMSATEFRRWIFRATTTNAVDPNTITFVNKNNPNANGWVEFDDAQVEAGNLASAYKTGTVSIAKLVTGRFTAADMIISTGGRVVSETYLADPNTGFLITDAGITIKSGQVDAKTLVANSTITNKLFVGNELEIALGGRIRSANYSDGSQSAPAGFRIDHTSIDIRSGTVGAGTLVAGTITSPDIKIGANGKITVDSTGGIESNNYSYTAPVGNIPAQITGWRIDSTGIKMDANSMINVNALETSTLTTTTITLGSNGIIQSNAWASGAGVRWQLRDDAFTMYGGSITGAIVNTGALTSTNMVEVSPGVTRPAFDINSGGYTTVTGIRIYGNALVGSGDENAMQSGNYNGPPNGQPGGGTTGWKIFGSGSADFHQLNTFGARIYGAAVIGGPYGSGTLQSSSYSPSSGGWLVGGDGTAEFNNGNFRVNAPDGSSIRMYSLPNNAPTPGAQIRIYRPGEEGANQFSIIRARTDNVMEMRNAKGGAIELQPAWYTGRVVVKITNDADIQGLARINAGIVVEGGGINVQGGGIGLNGGLNIRNGGADISGGDLISRTNNNISTGNTFLLGLSAPNGGGKREVLIEANSLLVGGQPRGSTIRIKEDVVDFKYTKEEVLSLRPVHYKLKPEFWPEDLDPEANAFSGVIAEEAQKAGLHDFVGLDEEGKPDDFDYQRFTAALLHVAREQQKEISELQRAVEKLQKRS